MNNDTEELPPSASEPSPRSRLDSWKEIAAYLKCSERTVRRWEEEGLPVHRRPHKKKAGIYAYKAEVDAWWRDGHERLRQIEEEKDEATAQSAAITGVQPWRRPWPIAGLGLAALVLLAVGLMAVGFRGGIRGKAPAVPIHSVAVLPLENLSQDPEQEYFADGMTDALITDLAKIHALRVISRNSIMLYKGKPKPMPQIAQELNVDAIVEGTVMRSGDHVRITAQLIEAPKDRHLWAETYEGDLRDILSLQDNAAKAIATAVKTTLTPQEETHLSGAHTVDPAAHQAYLRGLFKLHSNSNEKAIRYFEQALDHDPNDALAYAGLADAYYSQSSHEKAPSEVMPKAKAAALRAIELDDSLAEAHAALGYIKLFFDWDWSGGEQQLRQVLTLNPNLAVAHAHYAKYLVIRHRPEEAIQEFRLAYDLDPLVPSAQGNLVGFLFLVRRYSECIEAAKAIQEEDSRALSLCYAKLGRLEDALAAAARAERSGGDPITLAWIATTYAMAGEKDRANALLARILEQAQQRYICSYNIATVYVALGEKDKAFAALDQAFLQRSD
jgi:TolB-like protein